MEDPELIPTVSADELIAAERAERYRQQLERADVFPSAQNWDYITEHGMGQLADLLYRKYLISWLTDESIRTDYHIMAMERITGYLEAIDREDALAAVYGDVTSAPEGTIELIEKARLFSARHLLSILHGSYDETFDPAVFVVDCMGAYQPEYTRRDIMEMQKLLEAVRGLAPIGEMQTTRRLFGRENRYICPNGHVNPPDMEYCDTCGVNRYGFTREQDQTVENYAQRLTLLRRLLK